MATRGLVNGEQTRVYKDKLELRVLLADDSWEAIEQMSAWIEERLPDAVVFTARTPDEAMAQTIDKRIENLILDLDFGAQRASGVEVARQILKVRSKEKGLHTRVLFRTVHAANAGYLRQIEKLITEEENKPDVWGFLDKGATPKRIAQNAVEQVFIYELSYTDVFARQLRSSPSRDLSNLEYTILVYLCLGATNDGLGWLVGASRQSVERILTALYRKMKVPTRLDAPRSLPALLESRTRLFYEATERGLINPHLLKEEDTALKKRIRKSPPSRLYVNSVWLG